MPRSKSKEPPQSLVILGPGAMGCLLAARFCRKGFSVSLLGKDPRHLEAVRARGLVVESLSGRAVRVPAGEFSRISSDPEELGPCDILFICTKSYDTEEALKAAKPLMGPSTILVSFQNGIGHLKHLNRRRPPSRLVLGSAYFAASRLGFERVLFAGGSQIDLALNPENGESLRKVRGGLERSGWKVRIVGNELGMLWTKLVLNAAINPLGSLLGAANGELVRNEAVKELLSKAVSEGDLVARKSKARPLYKNMVQKAFQTCRTTAANKNSMLQDLERGKRTEIDSIVGPILRQARSLWIKTPALEGLHDFVKALEMTGDK